MPIKKDVLKPKAPQKTSLNDRSKSSDISKGSLFFSATEEGDCRWNGGLEQSHSQETSDNNASQRAFFDKHMPIYALGNHEWASSDRGADWEEVLQKLLLLSPDDAQPIKKANGINKVAS